MRFYYSSWAHPAVHRLLFRPMASSSDADVVVDSGSECETVRDTFENMNQTLHEIMIIVATWKTLTPHEVHDASHGGC